MKTDTHLGSEVKFRRQLLKLSQSDVANALGITQPSISRYELGQSDALSGKNVSALCRHLGLKLDTFQKQIVFLCPNFDCPISLLYTVNGLLKAKPAVAKGDADSEIFCSACGILMLRACPTPDCHEPLNEMSAFCSKCGMAYAPASSDINAHPDQKTFLLEHNLIRDKFLMK